MIGRANYAAALVDGSLNRRQQPFDALGLAQRHGRGGDLEAVPVFYGQLLQGAAPGTAWRGRLLESLGTKTAVTPHRARRAVVLMLASPEAQLM
jgi:hypothetical protein